MNIVKKTITVLLSILLVVLITPFNNVYAAATAPVLIVNCQSDGVDQIAKFKINGEKQLIKDADDGPNLPTGLTATWDDTQQRVILKVTSDTVLKGLLDIYSADGHPHTDYIIYCAEDLEITTENNSKLSLVVHPNPNLAEGDREYSYIKCNKNIYINNMWGTGTATKENTGLYFSYEDTDSNKFSGSNPYKNLEGIIAQNFSITHSTMVFSIRNSAFYCVYDKNYPIHLNNDSNNRLYIDNSKVAYDGAYHYSHATATAKDPGQRTMRLFTFDNLDNFEGDVTIKNNSDLHIGYSNSLPATIVSQGDSSIYLIKESTLNIDSSIVSFQSQVGLIFANVGKVIINNCKKAQDTDPMPILLKSESDDIPLFNTNSINITNSDFKMTTKNSVLSRPILEINTEGTGMGTGGGGTTPTPSTPPVVELNISEDDNLYDGSITVNNSNNVYAFSSVFTEPVPTEKPIYTKINLSLAGTKNAAVSNVTGPTSYTVVIDPSDTHTFSFETAANGAFNLTPLSQCKNFQILPNPGSSPTPGGDPGTGGSGGSSSEHSSHVVPNTGITK